MGSSKPSIVSANGSSVGQGADAARIAPPRVDDLSPGSMSSNPSSSRKLRVGGRRPRCHDQWNRHHLVVRTLVWISWSSGST
jgi:hypothetical protein